MAETLYNSFLTSPVEYQDFKQEDISLSSTIELPSIFDTNKHFIELHIYSIDGTRLQSINGYGGARQLGDSEGAGKEGASVLYIDPVADSINYGYERSNVKLTYNFLSSLFLDSFILKEISTDRTELKVIASSSTYNFAEQLLEIKERLTTDLYFNELRLNFGNNLQVIAVNIDQAEDGSMLLKLYEALPKSISVKATFSIVEEVSNPVAYTVQSIFIPDPARDTYLKGPNFEIEEENETSISTEYFDYSTLFSYPVTSSYHEAFTLLSSSGATINVDFTDYSNFIHFSSAEERLINFKYKLDLLHLYEAEKAATGSLDSASLAVSTSNTKYDNLVSGILSKFDEYEKYLYFESSSKAWPKSNSLRPYTNQTSSAVEATAWYTTQLASASLYDELNESKLTYSIPEFIRQDSDNAPYSLFIDMIAQHFDNLWLYTKAVTDKYDADNRLNHGLSRDLVGEALKSFGVKLYSSNFSATNLASMFLGEWYDSGSEQLTSFVTASNNPTPDRDILDETYKRLYHNLPYLLKTKGTERGLRALINCFGIPSGSLVVREFGGINTFESTPYYGTAVSASSKIRLDNTGSIVEGSTLSNYTSIQKDDYKYSQDNHVVEVGFSPSYYVDEFIKSNITGSFDIDYYIGDPRYAYTSSYSGIGAQVQGLNQLAETLLSGSAAYDVFDFIRLIKFFDNQLFKMVRDFVPARAVATTGIIIKPHMLNRSKVKQTQPTGTRPEYTASIDTAFTTGSDGGLVGNLSTAYTASVHTLAGTYNIIQSTEQEKFNGELGGANFSASNGELQPDNNFTEFIGPNITYDYVEYLVNDSPTITEEDFLNLPVSNGKMYAFWDLDGLGTAHYLKYLLLRYNSKNGINVKDSIREIRTIVISGTEYKPDSYNMGASTALLIFNQPKSGPIALNPASYPTTQVEVSVVLDPFVVSRFNNSDYDVLMNNGIAQVESSTLWKADYGYSATTLTNLDAIRSGSADLAELSGYNRGRIGFNSGRYNGKELTGATLNIFTEGDKSYGNNPVQEDKQIYFAYFDWAGGTSPEIKKNTAFHIRYLIDKEGNTYTPDADEFAYNDLVQNFATDSEVTVRLDDTRSTANDMSILNGSHRVVRSGAKIKPIVYTETGSAYTASISFGDEDVVDYRFSAQTTGSVAVSSYTEHTVIFTSESFDYQNYYSKNNGKYTLGDTPNPTLNFSATVKYQAPLAPNNYPDAQADYTLAIYSGSSVIATTGFTVQLQQNSTTSGNVTVSTGLNSYASAHEITVKFITDRDTVTLLNGSSFTLTQEPLNSVTASADTVNFWRSGSQFFPLYGYILSDEYIVANNELAAKYTLYQNDIEDSGFDTIALPFTIEVGDEIRFEGIESKAYMVTEVSSPFEEFRTASSPLHIGYLVVKLDKAVAKNTNLNRFLLRRFVKDGGFITLDVNKPAGDTSGGTIVPKFITKDLERNLSKALQTVKNTDKGL